MAFILCVFLIGLALCPPVSDADEVEANGGQAEPIVLPQLAMPVPANFRDNELKNVIIYFRNTTGFPIEADWPALEKWNIPKDTPVTLTLTNIPVGRTIELALVSAAGDRFALLLDSGDKLYITMRPEAKRLAEAQPWRWSYWRATAMPRKEDQAPPRSVASTQFHQPVPWRFKENRFKNIIDYLRNVTGTNIFVDWWALGTVGVDVDSRVTAKGDPTPASEVLDFVLNYLSDDLAWQIDEFGVVIISTRDGLEKLVPAPVEYADEDDSKQGTGKVDR